MAFPNDTDKYRHIGARNDEYALTEVRPTAVIGSDENLILLNNSHRNYTQGNLATVLNLSAWGQSASQAAFASTDSGSFVAKGRAPLKLSNDRTDFSIHADVEDGELEVRVYDSSGTLVTSDSVATTSGHREKLTMQLYSIPIITDSPTVWVYLKALNPPDRAYLYSLRMFELYSAGL